MLVRLQKYLADCGIASRRVAETLILAGKIKINQAVVKELGVKIDPQKDVIQCYEKLVRLPAKPIYLMLNKPAGYITTVKDPQDRKTVMSLLPPNLKVHPVGRLDKDSSGLLILTNDGELTQQLTHPKYRHEKEYQVQVGGKIDSRWLGLLIKGVKLEEGMARADAVRQVGDDKFNIIIHQGWKRQIRRMTEAAGQRVVGLKRVRVGKLKIGALSSGKYRLIKKEDII